MTRTKWSGLALDAYKAAGVQMKDNGYKPMRELRDPDCGTVLTFWAGAHGTVIQQTWTDSGDVVFWRAMPGVDEACSAIAIVTPQPERSANAKGAKK